MTPSLPFNTIFSVLFSSITLLGEYLELVGGSWERGEMDVLSYLRQLFFFAFRIFEYTGGYAIVREGCHKKTGEKFAVKIINLISSVPKTNESMEVGNRSTAIKEEEDGDDDSEEPEELSHIETMNEILLQQSIEHPNIVRIHEFFINRGIFRVFHTHSMG